MAINKNHLFEELDGIKCAIVESNVSKKRMDFLKSLLEYNGYTVIVVPAVTKPVVAKEGEPVEIVEQEEKYTLGVTHLAFNATNAIFGRLLKTKEGKFVTQKYWLQQEEVCNDEVPYYESW